MKKLIHQSFFCVAVWASATAASAQTVRQRFSLADPAPMVIAHRGCHNAAPQHGLAAVPENSLAALDHCVRLGVDAVEIDVRRSADGELVIIHDDTLDRTTNGHGYVAAQSLAKLRALRLRDNMGGRAALTEYPIATLAEMLNAARGHIFLNLDIKDAIYPEVIDAVLHAKMQGQVIVKNLAGPGTPVLPSLPPYDRVPFAPILLNADGTADLAAIAARQAKGARPVAFELPQMTPDQLPGVVAVAREAGVRLWVNTLWTGFLKGWGGDADALRDPDAVWGRMQRAGITIFQTDEPEALLAWRASRAAAHGSGARKSM